MWFNFRKPGHNRHNLILCDRWRFRLNCQRAHFDSWRCVMLHMWYWFLSFSFGNQLNMQQKVCTRRKCLIFFCKKPHFNDGFQLFFRKENRSRLSKSSAKRWVSEMFDIFWKLNPWKRYAGIHCVYTWKPLLAVQHYSCNSKWIWVNVSQVCVFSKRIKVFHRVIDQRDEYFHMFNAIDCKICKKIPIEVMLRNRLYRFFTTLNQHSYF